MSIVTVPMPDYSPSPQTGGGCDLTRSTCVFPCIQDARHCWVVQLGPGQGKLNAVKFNMVSMCWPMFNVALEKHIPLHCCSMAKKTVKQKKQKREGERGENISDLLTSMKPSEKYLSSDVASFHNPTLLKTTNVIMYNWAWGIRP